MNHPLIDLRTDERWGNRTRSLQVFVCHLCGSLSNRVDSRRWLGVTAVCPNDRTDWHARVAAKIERLRDTSHPKSYRRELHEEIVAIFKTIKVKDDLVGKPDTSQRGHLASILAQPYSPCRGEEDGFLHFESLEIILPRNSP